MSPPVLSITEAAAEIGCRPRDISDAFYQHHLDEARIFRLNGNRVIPQEYFPEVERVMRERGKVRHQEVPA